MTSLIFFYFTIVKNFIILRSQDLTLGCSILNVRVVLVRTEFFYLLLLKLWYL